MTDFARQVIAELPRDAFTMSFERIEAWLKEHRACKGRGLVFVASMAADPGGPGLPHHVGFLIQRKLAEHGFEVYLPAHALSSRRGDVFGPEAIASHRGALTRASMIVVPFGLPDTMPPSLEAALALEYVQDHRDVALVVAAMDEAVTFEGVPEYFGLLGAEITPPAEVNARVDGQQIADAVYELVERAAAAR